MTPDYTAGAFITDIFAAIGFATVAFLLMLLLASLIGRWLGHAAETQTDPFNAWLITPTTANLANVEAILEADSPISREDSLALCDALRNAWRENREQSALLLVAEAKLEANGKRAFKVVP